MLDACGGPFAQQFGDLSHPYTLRWELAAQSPWVLQAILEPTGSV